MNLRLLPTLLAAASLLLTGCLPESKNPLSTPMNSTVDDRLEGIYVSRREKKDEDLSTMHFHYRGIKANGQVRATPWLEVLDVEHEKAGGMKANAYRVLTTHIGEQDYMSFQDLSKGKDKAPYHFARYEFSWTGTLRIWLINSDAVADAIKAGKLRGTVKASKYTKDITITDSTERLAAFVKASDPVKLFEGKPMVLYRLTR